MKGFSQAEDKFERALALKPELSDAHFNLARAQTEQGRVVDAENSYRRAIVTQPTHASAHYNLANLLRGQGRLTEAETCYREALAADSDFAEAHCNLGYTLYALGKASESEGCFRRAIALSPGYGEAHSNLGITLQDLGRLDEAENSHRQAIRENPGLAEAHCNLGVTLQKLGRRDEAEASLTRAIDLKPGYVAALSNRSNVRFEKGQVEAALIDLDACDTEDTRARALEMLYVLERYDEILERLSGSTGLDGTNIRMAAFSAFLSEKLKKSTGHNFCPDPLSYVHCSNVNRHVESSEAFIRDLIEDLRKLDTTWEPARKATVNGLQMADHVTLFEQPSQQVQQLKSIILAEVVAYQEKFQHETCLFIRQWPVRSALYGWHVILKCEGYQNAHIHPEGWLSGVIYLQVVPSLGKDEGAIEFSLNGDHYSDPNSPSYTHQPVLGDIVLFPSSLHHRTIPYSTDAERIVVAFDLKPDLPSSEKSGGDL